MTTPEFGRRIAARYDELRPLGDGLEGLLQELDAAGDLSGRSVVDIGCGTGAIAHALVRDYGCRVVGIDPSPEMLAVAQRKEASGVTFALAPAERLPLADASLERALMRSVVHHLDRPAALAEVRRVLVPGGRLVIHNLDPDGLDELWFTRWFPSMRERERLRMPSADELEAELSAAGYSRVVVRRASLERRFDRETALAKLRGRHVSSFDLISEEEISAGLARAERELAGEVRYTLRSLVATAFA